MAKKLVAMIKTNGVGAQQPPHALNEIRIGGLDNQMKVVAHQAIRVELPAGLLTRFSQSLEEVLPVNVIQEDILPPVSSAHHMVNGTRVLNTDFARHEAITARSLGSASLILNVTV